MKYLSPVIAGAALLMSFGFALWQAKQPPRTGYIRMAAAMENYTPYREAFMALQDQVESWHAEGRQKSDDLRQALTALEAEASGLSTTELNNRREILKTQERDLKQFFQALSAKEERESKRLLQPVIDELNLALTEFGEKNELDIVLGALEGGNILYSRPELDFTDSFNAYLVGKSASTLAESGSGATASRDKKEITVSAKQPFQGSQP